MPQPFCSHGALAGMRNSSMGPPRRIDQMIHRTMSECSYHGATSRSLPRWSETQYPCLLRSIVMFFILAYYWYWKVQCRFKKKKVYYLYIYFSFFSFRHRPLLGRIALKGIVEKFKEHGCYDKAYKAFCTIETTRNFLSSRTKSQCDVFRQHVRLVYC